MPVLVLAVALVAALVGLGLMWRALDAHKDRESAADDARDSAREAAVHMTSYDHTTLEEDFAWVEEDGTDRFTETFTQASQPVKEAIKANQAHAEGVVTRSSVMLDDDSDTKATVLLFVDQTLTQAGSEEDAIEQTRVEMRLVREDGRWLVDEVEIF